MDCAPPWRLGATDREWRWYSSCLGDIRKRASTYASIRIESLWLSQSQLLSVFTALSLAWPSCASSPSLGLVCSSDARGSGTRKPVDGALRVPEPEMLIDHSRGWFNMVDHREGSHAATQPHAGRAAHPHPPSHLKESYNQELTLI